MKNLKKLLFASASALAAASAVSIANADPTIFKFGIQPDTQWVTSDDGLNPTSTAAGIYTQIDQQFITSGVSFVIAVGDLCDDSNTPALETRALYAQRLYNAGIGFYPLRGNHEIGDGNDSATDIATYFPQTVNGGLNNTTPITTAAIPGIVTAWGSNSYDSSTSVTTTAFANNPPPANTGSTFSVGTNFSYPSATNVPAAHGTAPTGSAGGGISYSFDYNNARFVLMDQWEGSSSNPTYWPQLRSWVDSRISDPSRPLQTYVFAHKNIIGGMHKDNFGGNSLPNDPGDINSVTEAAAFSTLSSANQTAATTKANYLSQIINDLYSNGVRYYFGGHDHHHKHSLIKDPLSTLGIGSGAAWVEQLIGQSASNKFYTPDAPYSPNETSIDEDLWNIGYYVVTVDGPRTTVDYYSVPVSVGAPSTNGNNVTVTPVLTGNWNKAITFGSSKNGQTFEIPQGSSYTTIADSTANAIANATTYGDVASEYVGTTLSILAGTNNSTETTYDGRALTRVVDTGWSAAGNAANTDSKSVTPVSDVATLWGLNAVNSSANDTIVVQLSFPAAAASSATILGSRDPATGNWYNAATIDVVGNTTKTFVNGPYNGSTTPGTYGVDFTNNVAWAVVNGNTRSFAVINNPNAIKGDFNNDGSVNSADLAVLTAAVNAHSTNPIYDLNGDGKVNSADERWLIQHYTH